MSFIDYLEGKILDMVWGNTAFTPASPLYVGLSTTTINDDGTGITEPSGGAYARVAVGNRETNSWPNAAAGIKQNGTAIIFPTATASWGNVTYFFISDASSGGNIYLSGSVNPSQSVGINDSARFSANDMTISLDLWLAFAMSIPLLRVAFSMFFA